MSSEDTAVTSTPDTSETAAPSLRLTGIGKEFGRIQAVKDISLTIRRNEVLGLIGENGAGKSSLLKILTGIHQPDRGTIEVNGKKVSFRRPQDATAAGIGVVHQEQALFTNLSVAENIAMNGSGSKDQGIRYGIYRWRTLNEEAAETLARVHAKVDPRAIVGDLSFVERQMVEIARALRVDEMVHAAPLVILDEPTSVLERGETEILEREIRDLKKIGSVIFVSHRLDEVMRICDRVVVMRAGEIVAERNTADVTEDELFALMIGHNERAEMHPKDRSGADPEPALEVEGLSRKHAFRDITFTLTPGRTLAIVGTNGSGRDSVCRAIFGAETYDSGVMNHASLGAVKYESLFTPVRARTSGSSPAALQRRTMESVCFDIHMIALWAGVPVRGSQAKAVSRWVVIPIAATSAGVAPTSASTRRMRRPLLRAP